ncbi:MAG: acyl-CoA dehydrogenase [Deltaproteobacteria bacterium]|jgi:acyl-CoA dehydrogenase|nr:acyl-CoA dehydrogenase [Deltaproteobacteria bacterium]MBT4267163.1 acyl-CoA dehydrogenase [Deltaproteobacteria bacterium]MBT4644628.1 acyl-CoA dehydrogenase [Deltaproteobacteria bacterium]MBT6499812.1 acyl-CoA dehydrogenase [Deltaproteobacteria bacterium]MBT6614835.1 acyl-CoA dehydrogenase [Deltaproteobacteria bacterium]
MAFEPSEKLQSILDMMSEFVDKEIIPMEHDMDTKGFNAMEPELERKREMVRQMELWAPLHPKEYGGMGLPLMDTAMIFEVLGRTPYGLYIFGCQAPDAGNIEILHKFGTEEQKEKWCRPNIEGKIRSSFSMTEVEVAGSNPTWLLTTAEKDGDEYVINGHKWYTSCADGATYAIVMAETNPEEASPHKRASMIIVPIDTPGFNIVRNISVMGHVGSGWNSHAEVLYQNCRVPKENILDGEGMGFILSQQRLGPGRIHHCMRWIGICNRCFELMCAYAKKRRRTPSEVLADSDIIKTYIADSAADILSSRLMVLNAAWTIQNKGVKYAMKDISLIKFYVANAMQRVVDRALQVHGGLGMSNDTPIANYYLEARASRIYDGADEVHKISVARRILKEY